MIKVIAGMIFLFGFIYLILPGPGTINDFSHLPISLKSQLAGDTIQNPNIAAYYSNYDRSLITKFYQEDLNKNYCQKTFLGLPNPLCFIPPIKLNHPPEEAFIYIRDQQESTYLEEYLYPFRESLFVNGYEPVAKNGKLFSPSSKPIEVNKMIYFSKTTIRYYPSFVWFRVLVYLGVWGSFFAMYKLSKKIFK